MAYHYEEFKRDVYKLTDINLDLYKERQMKRRIESLIARKGFDGFESFYKGMKQDEGLLRTFVSYLTINVSQFYRNPQQWMNLIRRSFRICEKIWRYFNDLECGMFHG